MKIVNLSNPSIGVTYGGAWDRTKAVSPHVTVEPDGTFTMYYVGTNCLPHERRGYRLLSAKSRDGMVFVKQEQPLLPLQGEGDKHYSPCVLRVKDKRLLFYGLGARGKYAIYVARASSDEYVPDARPIIDVGPMHSAAVHSPKVFLDDNDVLTCYYTGSHKSGKVYSKRFPDHDFAQGFRIFRTQSHNGKEFGSSQAVDLEGDSFLNIYGHSFLVEGGRTYLVFTGFDGSVNRLYLTVSNDGLHFSPPTMLCEPVMEQSELGIYSSSIVRLPDGTFRVYYGCRYLNNHWNIASRTFAIDD